MLRSFYLSVDRITLHHGIGFVFGAAAATVVFLLGAVM